MKPRAKFQPDAVTPLVVTMLVGAIAVATIGVAPYVFLILEIVR